MGIQVLIIAIGAYLIIKAKLHQGMLFANMILAARALQPPALAAKFRRDALYLTGLEDAAAGAAGTRLMAKVMARLAMEDGIGTGFCPAGEEAETLGPLSPGCLPGLSPQCRERIRRYSLESVGQIRALGRGRGEAVYPGVRNGSGGGPQRAARRDRGNGSRRRHQR